MTSVAAPEHPGEELMAILVGRFSSCTPINEFEKSCWYRRVASLSPSCLESTPGKRRHDCFAQMPFAKSMSSRFPRQQLLPDLQTRHVELRFTIPNRA